MRADRLLGMKRAVGVEVRSFIARCLLGAAVSVCACDDTEAADVDSDPTEGGKADDAEDGANSIAGTPLTDDDRDRIESMLDDGPMYEPGDVADAVFLLHDTAGASSSAYMQEQVDVGRGPLGAGPQVWVNRHDTFFARPFFSRWRPSATLHEKAVDIMASADELAEIGRRVWDGAPELEREAILGASLDAVTLDELGPDGLEEEEIADEIDKARALFGRDDARLYTTALWTLEGLVEEGHAVTMPEARELEDYFEQRNARIERTLNVELGQGPGNCTASDVVPAYDDFVYEQMADLYLHSALVAGVFPRVDTHFWTDRAFRGHCDPRCFDLDRLYDEISERMDHEPGTQYGVPPVYGTGYGQDTIWWREDSCGAPAPR